MTDQIRAEMALQVMGVASLLGDDTSKADIFTILGKVMSNTFNICDVDGTLVGLGVYLVPSLLNHSCEPNAVVVFHGRQLALRSIRPLSPGDQVCVEVAILFLLGLRGRL